MGSDFKLADGSYFFPQNFGGSIHFWGRVWANCCARLCRLASRRDLLFLGHLEARTSDNKYRSRAGAHQRREMTDSAETRRKASAAADFRQLYDAHFQLVWRALRRLGVHGSDMMDLTQRVFMIAFMKLPQFEGRSTISTWLYAICYRVASEHWRSPAARNEVPTDPENLAESPAEAKSESTDVALARHVEVERILAKLSKEQRVVFLLYEVDEFSGAEIASILNVSVGTVRSRLRHARAIFRREVRRLALTRALSVHGS